ncbi:MAG: hypothetical protein IV100_09715 [Myxococcales bacterium]|nr:hypothetical protein [Myxococcales bacterium]
MAPPRSGAIADCEGHNDRAMVCRGTSDLGTWSWDAQQDLGAGIAFEVELDPLRPAGGWAPEASFGAVGIGRIGEGTRLPVQRAGPQ